MIRLKEASEKEVLGYIFFGLADGLDDVIEAFIEFVEVGIDK
jgi:hypothetical protein